MPTCDHCYDEVRQLNALQDVRFELTVPPFTKMRSLYRVCDGCLDEFENDPSIIL